ncbi:hypothetical protein AAE478_006772 [Parahypoxylon ruwenzoriense]
MEFISSPLECQSPTNNIGSYIRQSSLVGSSYGTDSDISRYLILPLGPSHQVTASTADDRGDTVLRPQFGYSEKSHNDDTESKREHKRTVFTHSRRSSRSSNKVTSDESGVDKRERNRLAASKCRKKQKLANNELQERARIMGEQHDYLMAHKASLESEMINLKNELLLHGSCGCEPITHYLMQSAKKFVKGHEEHAGNTHKAEDLRERWVHTGDERFVL